MADYEELHADEVRDLAAFLRTLSADQWDQPTLCAGWRVRDVVGHMLAGCETAIWRVPGKMVRSGFNVDRMSTRMSVDRAEGRDPAALIADFEAHSPAHGLARAFPMKSTFLDRVVHHQDIRRPLAAPREIPEERLTAALDVAVSGNHGVKSNKRAKGLALTADDVSWAHGDGPVVRGPGEAILMALCGRGVVADELDGDGVEALRSRMP